MMHDWLRVLLEAFLPLKSDVRIARSITEEELAALCAPHRMRESWIVALFPYRDARIRALVRSVKFYGEKMPLPTVGRIMGEYILEVVSDKKLFSGWDVPLLIPMPVSYARLRERGYNQVERFAEATLPFLGTSVTYAPKVLRRKDRKSQVRVPRAKRADNIRGAFFVPDTSVVAGTHIILLDDVAESGATLQDARHALLSAGALDVIGIAIAH